MIKDKGSTLGPHLVDSYGIEYVPLLWFLTPTGGNIIKLEKGVMRRVKI